MQASFARYDKAGAVWTSTLRQACHNIAAVWMNLFPGRFLNNADRNKIIAHVAAIPVVLKQQLRDSSDLRELKGLFSDRDLAALQYAPNMSLYCIDVIRSYLYKPTLISNVDDKSGQLENFIWADVIGKQLLSLEQALSYSFFVKDFTLSPGFLSVLNVMLGIWFMILPFVLAEVSGWFTILWVPLIAYSVLGMYAVASELQQPFGNDLNDLDLDTIAHEIVQDVLSITEHYKNGLSDMLIDDPSRVSNSEFDTNSNSTRLISTDDSTNQNISKFIALITKAASFPLLVGLTAWATLSVLGSLIVNIVWELPPGVNAECKPWWCSRVSVHPAVNGFVGFALFLLLGFRLLDSHSRYTNGVIVWIEGLVQMADILSSHILEGMDSGTIHNNDMERVTGHIAAVAITLVAKMRGENCNEKLQEVVSDSDASRILRSNDPTYYCIDVTRAYLIDLERQEMMETIERNFPVEDLITGCSALDLLDESARHCERLVNVPLPFGYVQHMRIFIAIWLMILPLGLVESAGWYSILWTFLIAYGILGVEHWATELSDPFGYDESDIPLEKLQCRLIGLVKQNQEMFKNRAFGLIDPKRKAFEMGLNQLGPVAVGEDSSLLPINAGQNMSSEEYGSTVYLQ